MHILNESALTNYMADLFINKYRRQTRRNRTHDYGSNCWYLITINTFNRKKHFGEIEAMGDRPSLHPTSIGQIAMDYWLQIPQHYPYVELNAFVIMPNHLHGILKIQQISNDPGPNKFGGQKNNLASVVNGFKSSVKRYANKNRIDFKWQSNYFESIIYTKGSLEVSRIYVNENLHRADSASDAKGLVRL